jgi:2-polyprenyl-6-methoxyphenol hydroxylase-like FAD-dependent oxidoreductase
MSKDYDAIVVGARCAGAPTARLLAQAGYRVLVVDRATFPSDTLSTLLIHTTGVGALRRWGLLDDVTASGCPPLDTYTFDFGPYVISGTPHPYDGSSTAYAPRRVVLDKLLVDAAARAGAEVREGFSVEDLVFDDGAVVGIRGRDAAGGAVVERARVVIGADGWNSRVARIVRPDQYSEKPMLENAFYTFWSGLPMESFLTTIRGDRAFAAIPTNDELTLLLVGFPMRDAGTFKADVEGNYLAALDREPAFAERVRNARREVRFAGGGVPNFFRKPYGPGWALVGDAGYTRDPVTAQGISDAFRDAELCAAGLQEAFDGRRTFDAAMADYHEARDRRVRPIFEFTTQMATLEPPPPEMQQLLSAAQGNKAAMDAFVSVIAGTMSPADFLHPDHVGRILAGAAA